MRSLSWKVEGHSHLFDGIAEEQKVGCCIAEYSSFVLSSCIWPARLFFSRHLAVGVGPLQRQGVQKCGAGVDEAN